MIIFPAIDIKDGKCVRLRQGRFDDVTIYSDNPVEIAQKWEKEGCQYLHLVDLDGAIQGIPNNLELIKEIVSSVSIPVQIGGGIRSRKTVDVLFECGVERVIIGTLAVRNPELLEQLIRDYGNRIVVSIDANDGFVAVDGWINLSSINSIEFAKDLEKIGVKTIVYTDISKDGMMKGPNFKVYEELKKKVNINIIASGGISSAEDVKKLKEIGVYGCIVGKAIYSGAVKITELLKYQIVKD
ncbi:1-(5-phosphoribosyl)-5-[(5-phosphoribosylamino)methylideneamino] imidazole-4-carboxamide isomerase [Caloranaerobacter sp. TR13]|uniref:1-(5-phosphoribosyl)-5-[(5- phosphoribosylamino)methylideneamino]imidazole-4- carboxamide isomerase n=1 Tax=Caloranaerobacter sp. TR13 TaxID=1302151 RepID=UPI0006D3DA38|nr:1-(5-phosphoribosyl)-5-[(5-phosphoribosylamino)methylideneamino]imidazole-4-carboxamide isomerase [Caloranaerobacter sp. TR13]KPU27121.1 1-(5-phosphoribosyl)-5-[(5-phosphoribosylamino)methylideneamino] imidazole-4-carboxamide isomerase [Caloranaerobacter sp. TR13]